MPYENSMDAKYEELISTQARWFSDGNLDRHKDIQKTFSNQSPTPSEMNFIHVLTK